MTIIQKLRDIEMIAQERLQALADAAGEGADEEAASGGGEGEVLRQIQAILYSTEDGFEVPEGNEVSILAFEALYDSYSSIQIAILFSIWLTF